MPTKKKAITGRLTKWHKKCRYATGSQVEYVRLKQYTQRMFKLGIIENEWMGDAFKVLAEIMLSTEGMISEGMLMEYKQKMKKP